MDRGVRIKLAPCSLTRSGALDAAFVLPTGPLEEFTTEWAYDHQDYMTIRAGEFSRRTGRKLRVISLDTLASDEASSFWTSADYDPEEVRTTLRDLLLSGSPFQFVATQPYGLGGGQRTLVDMWATLRSLRATERAGEIDAFYFTCEFHEYRDPIVRRDAGKRSTSQRTRTITLYPDGSYVGVHTQDEELTIRVIATYVYRDPSATKAVAKAIGVTDWGSDTPLVNHPKFKRKGGKITCPPIPSLSDTRNTAPTDDEISDLVD